MERAGSTAPKKIVGRKRHIAVDTDGRLLMVNLTTANIADSAGAQAVLEATYKRWPKVKHLFADSAPTIGAHCSRRRLSSCYRDVGWSREPLDG